MKTKIGKLKQIISSNAELNIYFDSVQDDWNQDKFNKYVHQILKNFEQYHDKEDRPKFYTELETLLNKYCNDNTYEKPLVNNKL